MTDAGRVISLVAAVGSGIAIEIKPDGTEEWVVHNIYHSNNAALYIVRGGLEIRIDDQEGSNAWINHVFHVKNEQFLKLKDWSGGSQNLGYDGVCTHGG